MKIFSSNLNLFINCLHINIDEILVTLHLYKISNDSLYLPHRARLISSFSSISKFSSIESFNFVKFIFSDNPIKFNFS